MIKNKKELIKINNKVLLKVVNIIHCVSKHIHKIFVLEQSDYEI